jgi:MFS transporter, DHA1 family, tetracycline resistance protein
MSRISFLGLLMFMLMFSISMVYPVMKPFVVERFDTTLTEASLFVSVNLLAYVIFSVIWGALSDRLGKRRIFIITGLFGNALLMYLVTTAPSLPVLLILRFVEGSFSIMAFSLIMTSAVDTAHKYRVGRGIGVAAMSFALGNAFGAPAGGRLGSVDPMLPFYTGAVLLTVAGLLAVLFLRDAPAMRRALSVRGALSLLAEDKRLFIPYAFSFIDRFTVGFFVGLFPLFLASRFNAEPAAIGLYMFLFLLPFALLQYPGGILSDRIGRGSPIIIGSIIYGVCVLLVGMVNLPVLAVVMVVGGTFGAFMFAPSAALVGDLAPPEKRGIAMGGFNLFGSLGFVIGPFTGGLIADAYGFSASFAFAGMSEIVIAIVFIPAFVKLHRHLRERAVELVPEVD